MRKVIRKVFFVWQFDKEEKWLNEMAAKGLALVGVGYCRYEFEECDPGEYGLKIELLDNPPKHPESEQYIKFIESTGAEQVGSYMRWVYFRKKTADGPFDLFSDNSSRIKHLNRVLAFIATIGGINLFSGVYNIVLYLIHHMSISLLGCINIAIAIWTAFGYYRIWKQKKLLQKEQQLFE